MEMKIEQESQNITWCKNNMMRGTLHWGSVFDTPFIIISVGCRKLNAKIISPLCFSRCHYSEMIQGLGVNTHEYEDLNSLNNSLNDGEWVVGF